MPTIGNSPNTCRKLFLVCVEAAGQLVLDTIVEGVCRDECHSHGPKLDEACK